MSTMPSVRRPAAIFISVATIMLVRQAAYPHQYVVDATPPPSAPVPQSGGPEGGAIFDRECRVQPYIDMIPLEERTPEDTMISFTCVADDHKETVLRGWNENMPQFRDPEWKHGAMSSLMRIRATGRLDANGGVHVESMVVANNPREKIAEVRARQDEARAARRQGRATHGEPGGRGRGGPHRNLRASQPPPATESEAIPGRGPNSGRGRSLATRTGHVSDLIFIEHTIITIQLVFTNAGPARSAEEQAQLQFRMDQDSVRSRTLDFSLGQVDFIDAGVYQVPVPYSTSSSCNRPLWADAADKWLLDNLGIVATDYRYRLYHLPYGNTCKSIGNGALCYGGCDSGRSWMNKKSVGLEDDYTYKMSGILHELGHNQGMHHASTLTYEYGDLSCFMGISDDNMKALNPPHAYYSGYYDEGVLSIVEGTVDSVAVTLTSLTRYSEGQGQIPIVEVQTAGGYLAPRRGNLYIGFMRAEGYQLDVAYGDTVTVSSWEDPVDTYSFTFHQASLGEREVYSYGDFRVAVNKIDLEAGTADISVSFVGDECADDPTKTTFGVCGCGVPDTDSDGDGTEDCMEQCPADPNKVEPGYCGCGLSDADSDADGEPDCVEGLPSHEWVPKLGVWSYLEGGAVAPNDWTQPLYDDSAWLSGAAVLGFPASDGPQTVINGNGALTFYFRRHFVTPINVGSFAAVRVHLLRDDGAVVYVNGVEVARSNMPEGDIEPTTRASTSVSSADEDVYHDLKIPIETLHPGDNVIAVEVHQSSTSSSDALMDASIIAYGVDGGVASPSPTRTVTPSRTPTSSRTPTPSPSPSSTPLIVALQPIASGSQWSYLDGGDQPASSAWTSTSFDDSTWSAGNAQLGYGDSDETTVISYGSSSSSKAVTYYFRRAFVLPHPAASVVSATLHLLRDDGAVVYVNGVEVVRSNMPAGAIDFSTFSASMVDGSEEDTFYTFSLPTTAFVDGENVVAIEVHQRSFGSSDVSMDASLEVAFPMALFSGVTMDILPLGATWKYLDNGYVGLAGWTDADYDDAWWSSGAGQFGYGDSDEATVLRYGSSSSSKAPSYFFRAHFDLPSDVSAVQTATLHLLRDDGAVAYVNGVEVARTNMPEGTVYWYTWALSAIGGAEEDTYYAFDIPLSSLLAGQNTVAVEVHQASGTSSDMSMDAYVQVTWQ